MPDLKRDDWTILTKLVSIPFADIEEIAYLSDVTPHRTTDALARLGKLGLAANILHCTPTTKSSGRHFLTRKGVRLYLKRALMDIHSTPSPITREWYQSLLRRLDSVRTVYRVARSFVPADMDMRHRTPEIIWYRKGNWDAALRFYDGTTVPIMVQGRSWGMPVFNSRIKMTNEHDEKHIGGLLIVAPDYYAANKALTTLRKVNSKLPAFACEESKIGKAKSTDKIWLPTDLERFALSARDIYLELNKGRWMLPRKLAKRANFPWVKMPEDALLWSKLKSRDKRYLDMIAKFYFLKESHLRRIDGLKLQAHKKSLKRLSDAGLVNQFQLQGEDRVALSDEGLKAISLRDRLLPKSALIRRSMELDESGNYVGSEMQDGLHSLRHDDGVNETIALFSEHARRENVTFEFEVARHLHRGYEDRLGKKRQLAPDLQVSLSGGGFHFIEVELRARTPTRLTTKIMPYIHYYRAKQWEHDLRLEPTSLFILRDAATAYKFLLLARNICDRERVVFPLGVTDMAAVVADNPVSKPIWLSRTSLLTGHRYPLHEYRRFIG